MPKAVKPYFPMFMDISEKKVYVVGAGTIAKRRIRALAEYTNHLTVIAPEVNPELNKMEQDGEITILRKKCEAQDILDGDLVIAASNDHKLNEDIYQLCREHRIMVSVCSDKKKCDFYFPSLVRRDNVVIGISANGSDQKKAKSVIEKIREIIETCW